VPASNNPEGVIEMTRTKSIIGALALCAVSICAFAAVSASAAEELTAVTCKEKVGGKYKTNHCETPAEGSGFETEVIPLNETTEVTAKTVEKSEPALRATIAGAKVTIKCASSELIGASIKNKEPSAGKHTIETTATRNTYSNCHAYLKENETRRCVVEGVTAPGGLGMISTTALKGTTIAPSGEAKHRVKVEPQTGTEFAKFTIKKEKTEPETEKECFFGSDVTVTVTGSVEGECDTEKHSHLTFKETNNGTALKANGATANYIDTVVGNMAGGGTTVGAETFT
jgi:hypothetical protein